MGKTVGDPEKFVDVKINEEKDKKAKEKFEDIQREGRERNIELIKEKIKGIFSDADIQGAMQLAQAQEEKSPFDNFGKLKAQPTKTLSNRKLKQVQDSFNRKTKKLEEYKKQTEK